MQIQINENAFDTVVLYTFLRKLTTPFKDWKAYKLGIIDADGNILRKRKTLRTQEEKSAFTVFDLLVRNLKKILEKLPGGRSRLASFAAGLYLIREEANAHIYQDEDICYESFIDFLELQLETTDFLEKGKMLLEERELSKILPNDEEIEEDAPANSVAGGGIAGLTVATGGPVIRKKPKKLKKFKEDLEPK